MSKRRPNQPHSDGQHTRLQCYRDRGFGYRWNLHQNHNCNCNASLKELREPTRISLSTPSPPILRYLAAKYRAASVTARDVQVAPCQRHLFVVFEHGLLSYRPPIFMHQRPSLFPP
ncbi:hypothetical protein CGRA01v4_06635 [Colletotrichum graminicola]|nr:hypothetical protein CGRA01v4_06635 [Colletotrichum graminicola]